MRAMLIVFSVAALLAMGACSGGDDNPNNVPRTVPPAGTEGAAAAVPKVVEGTGPKIEALAAPSMLSRLV